MAIHPCEAEEYGMLCGKPSWGRVRLYYDLATGGVTTTDIDLCHRHSERAGEDYPDNIKLLERYPMSYMPPTEPMQEMQTVISRSELLELMGELALPPFKGHPEANDWDCAPMAQAIVVRVDAWFAERMPGSMAPGEQIKSPTRRSF